MVSFMTIERPTSGKGERVSEKHVRSVSIDCQECIVAVVVTVVKFQRRVGADETLGSVLISG